MKTSGTPVELNFILHAKSNVYCSRSGVGNLFLVEGQKQIERGLDKLEKILPNNVLFKSAHIFGILVFITIRSNLSGCEFNDSIVALDKANQAYTA